MIPRITRKPSGQELFTVQQAGGESFATRLPHLIKWLVCKCLSSPTKIDRQHMYIIYPPDDPECLLRD